MKVLRLFLVLFCLGFFILGCDKEPTEVITSEEYQTNGTELVFVRDQQIHILDKQSELRALTRDAYHNYAPAWMPGAKEIVYLSQEAEYTKFWQLNLSTLDKKYLSATKGQPTYLSISPQSKQLLYLEENILYLQRDHPKVLLQFVLHLCPASAYPTGQSQKVLACLQHL